VRQTGLLTNRSYCASSGSLNATKPSARLDTCTLFRIRMAKLMVTDGGISPTHCLMPSPPEKCLSSIISAISSYHVCRPDLCLSQRYAAGFTGSSKNIINTWKERFPGNCHGLDSSTCSTRRKPFLEAMVLYVIVLIFTLFSWLKWPKTLGKTAVILLVGAFLLHTVGLLVRMYCKDDLRLPICIVQRSCRLGFGSSLPFPRAFLQKRGWEHVRFNHRSCYPC